MTRPPARSARLSPRRLFVLLAALPALLFGVNHHAPAQEAERVVVLGFDGADPDAIEALIAAGELPNLRSLAAEGTLAPLETTKPSESPVAWATFATGMNPGRTRIFDFLEKREGTYVPQIALVRQETTRLPGPLVRLGLVLLFFVGLASRCAG